MAMTNNVPPRQPARPAGRSMTPTKPAPPTRKAKSLHPLAYLDVRAVAETCVIEAMRQVALRGGGEVSVALSAAHVFEVFRRQVRGETAVAPSFKEGFGDVADSNDTAERFGICLAVLVEEKLLGHVGRRPMQDTLENGQIIFQGVLELTTALMEQIDMEETAVS